MIKLRYISSISRSRGLPLSLDNLPARVILAAGLVPRPLPGLSPRAHSRDRAPPPSRATLNCARFAGSCETAKYIKACTFSICFAPGQVIVSSCCCSSCCSDDQASIYLFDRSVSRSTAFSRQPLARVILAAGLVPRPPPGYPRAHTLGVARRRRAERPSTALVSLDLARRQDIYKLLLFYLLRFWTNNCFIVLLLLFLLLLR